MMKRIFGTFAIGGLVYVLFLVGSALGIGISHGVPMELFSSVQFKLTCQNSDSLDTATFHVLYDKISIPYNSEDVESGLADKNDLDVEQQGINSFRGWVATNVPDRCTREAYSQNLDYWQIKLNEASEFLTQRTRADTLEQTIPRPPDSTTTQ